ncbi:type III pantothenate kinase [Fulvivirga lutea]|uniref:Type III pantothenate kinase n=1 Tax=Fulvivirga lutea TaxID=2810512 RepID=A0A974WHP2_9BACT|nr:type III pantothenate kinase [Fulvivirga lutea]QSE98743.1 type III pantothenate kinase [Fulvivirga lutea]
MNLVIDFGNTTGKVGLFTNNDLIKVMRPVQLDDIAKFFDEYDIQNTIISSSSISTSNIRKKVHGNCLELSHKTPLPFAINYKTPETLGLDRIAGVAGAYFNHPNENCLVIDIGTCITYDVLVNGQYPGGAISPGLTMRFKALNTFTANLPLVENEGSTELVGDSTKNSILSGVANGMAAEIDGFIENFNHKFGPLKVLICGGDYIFFENKLKASIFAAPELVLKGLNGILQYNVS